jgi:hypothetical protein
VWILQNFNFQQRFRIAQVGTLAQFVFFRFRTALLGMFLWHLYVCPEVFVPYKFSGQA